MERRRFLASAALGVTAATAGCAGVLDTRSPEWRLRAQRASESVVEATETECTLNEPFVTSHPNLERVLSLASEESADEWQVVPVELEAGNELGRALTDFCGGDIRGVYHYREEAYLVSLVDVRPGNDVGHGGHHHGNGTDDGHSHALDGRDSADRE